MGMCPRSKIFPIQDCFGEVELETWLFESLSGVAALETCLGSRLCSRILPNEAITDAPLMAVYQASECRKRP